MFNNVYRIQNVCLIQPISHAVSEHLISSISAERDVKKIIIKGYKIYNLEVN